MVSNGFPNVTTSGQQYNIGEKPSVILLLLLLLFPHISSPISRTRGQRRRLPFPYHRYIKKIKQKKRKRGKNNRRESLPRSVRRGGGKIKTRAKNKSKDPPRISERQKNKQARQTKCQDHTTVDTVRESLSTPHQPLGGGSGQSNVETKEHQYSNAKNHPLLFCGIQIDIMGELKRQSSENFLRVAGVGLVHTLGGPGRPEDFSPRLYFTVPLRCILVHLH